MSRSHRKTPIFGITTAQSERRDKQHWHRRWRLQERMALRKLAPTELDTHIDTDARAAGNVWAMAKDGRQYWPSTEQMRWAEAQVQMHPYIHDPDQAKAVRMRLIRKVMAK